MEEHQLIQVVGQVMLYDAAIRQWHPAGTSSGLSTVRLVHCLSNNTFRIHGQKMDELKEVVLDSQITREVRYNRANEAFIQWNDAQAFWGLNFRRGSADAENFFSAVVQVLKILNQNTTASQQQQQQPNMPQEVLVNQQQPPPQQPPPQQQLPPQLLQHPRPPLQAAQNPYVIMPQRSVQLQQQHQMHLQHIQRQHSQPPPQAQNNAALMQQSSIQNQQHHQQQSAPQSQQDPSVLLQQLSMQQIHQHHQQVQNQQQQQQQQQQQHQPQQTHPPQQQQNQQQQQQQQQVAPPPPPPPPPSAVTAPIPPPPPPPPAPPAPILNNAIKTNGTGPTTAAPTSSNGSDKESECNNNSIPNAKTARSASLAYVPNNLMSDLSKKLASRRERIDQQEDGPTANPTCSNTSITNGSSNNLSGIHGMNGDKNQEGWLADLIRKEISKEISKLKVEIIDAIRNELRQTRPAI